ncbi:hypothetical protein COOONC_06002 [Cooperia oncophora]
MSPPSPAERYPPRFRSNSPPSSSDYAMSVRDPALRRPRPAQLYYSRPLRTGYSSYSPQHYSRSPYSEDSVSSSYRRHGYSRYHDSTPQEISEDDGETVPNSVRQRRLPLIGSIPPVSGSELRSAPYAQPSYPAGQFASPPYRPPSVVSPVRPHHQDYYPPRENYYDIPSPSPAGNDVYHGHGYNRSSPSRYPSVVYAHDTGPRTRIIQAQSGAIPLSDSDSDDQERWAVV